MPPIILVGHKVAKGKAWGEALVSKQAISLLGGLNPKTGIIIEKNHELEGLSITGKILVFPWEKGSTSGSIKLYDMAFHGTHPKAIINIRSGPIIAIGTIVSNIPAIDKLNLNPCEMISTGDRVEVDADNGIVKVYKNRPID